MVRETRFCIMIMITIIVLKGIKIPIVLMVTKTTIIITSIVIKVIMMIIRVTVIILIADSNNCNNND